MEPLHHIHGTRDPVDGSYRTRCLKVGWIDRRGLPRVAGEGEALANLEERFLTAMWERDVTCAKCKLKVTPTEKKILRLMYDYRDRKTVFLIGGKKFSWKTGSALTVYGNRMHHSHLIKKGLLGTSVGGYYQLSREGELLAATYPKVKRK